MSGPLGTFLMHQEFLTVSADDRAAPTWWLRRIDGTTLGDAHQIPETSTTVPGGSDTKFFSWDVDTSAAIVEDQANGRLHFARWLPSMNGHDVRMTSTDGIG